MIPIDKEAAELDYEDWLILGDGYKIVDDLEDQGYKWVYMVRDASAIPMRQPHVVVTGEVPGWDLIVTKKFIVPASDMVMIGPKLKAEASAQRILKFYGDDGDIILGNKHRKDWAALVHRATRPGVEWQGTMFDTDGPYGHIEGKTREGVMRRLVEERQFTVPDPNAMRRVLGAKANR